MYLLAMNDRKRTVRDGKIPNITSNIKRQELVKRYDCVVPYLTRYKNENVYQLRRKDLYFAVCLNFISLFSVWTNT